jgi:hypothetical protein
MCTTHAILIPARPAANAQDYQALLARHQQAEAGLARAREAAADMRARLEAVTGPQGPQARLRQAEGQLAQVRGAGAATRQAGQRLELPGSHCSPKVSRCAWSHNDPSFTSTLPKPQP